MNQRCAKLLRNTVMVLSKDGMRVHPVRESRTIDDIVWAGLMRLAEIHHTG